MSCAARIEKGLGRLEGVSLANVNFAMERAAFTFDDTITDQGKLWGIVERLGYSVIREDQPADNKATLNITGIRRCPRPGFF